MRLNELKDKKILILGFGKEGIDSYLALRRLFPQKQLAVADEKKIENYELKIRTLINKDKKIKLYLGKNYLASLKNYDLIIKTPGIPEKTYRPFIKEGSEISSQTKIFFDNFPGLIIGVTGTKGKGTTSGLIYQILKIAGFKAYWLGNVGRPVFQHLLKSQPEHIAVYELSSHQLQDLKKSPHIAVFLNLFPDHLDYYKNFNDYKKAKENIALYQKKDDFFIYNPDEKIVMEIAKKTKARKITFRLKDKKEITKIINPKEIPLKGDFNLLNAMAAVSVGKIFKIPNQKIKEAVKSFQSLPHRLEFVGKYKGIEFYNDSMSTVPEAAIAALQALGSKATTIILGGSDKGSDYSDLAEKIAKSNIKTLIIFSGIGKKVLELVRNCESNLPKKKLRDPFFVSSMQEAVKIGFKKTKRGEACLLSPGAASFNLFRNYQERGNLFKKFVKRYGKK